MNSFRVDTPGATALRAHVTDDTLSVELADGRTISVPIAWYPRLAHGTPAERTNWRLIGGGRGIHWPDLDEDISVENLLGDKPSGESQTSLNGWLGSSDSEPPGGGFLGARCSFLATRPQPPLRSCSQSIWWSPPLTPQLLSVGGAVRFPPAGARRRVAGVER